MSFEHRFGVGIGGSHEDPHIFPWCETCPDAVYNRCPRTEKFIRECEEFSKTQSSTPTAIKGEQK